MGDKALAGGVEAARLERLQAEGGAATVEGREAHAQLADPQGLTLELRGTGLGLDRGEWGAGELRSWDAPGVSEFGGGGNQGALGRLLVIVSVTWFRN